MPILVSRELLEDALVFPQFMAVVMFDMEHPGEPRYFSVERPGFRPWLHRLWCRVRHVDDEDLRGWIFMPTQAFLQFKAERGL